MDDVIRPFQAARRRSLHKEARRLDSHLEIDTSEASASDLHDTTANEDDDGDVSEPTGRDGKRKRCRMQSPEPTRRSSRRRINPGVSYNMKVHPQDSDLNRIWACDGSKSSPSNIPTDNDQLGLIAEGGPVGDFDVTHQSLSRHIPQGKL